jgi:hypothetical protein
MNLHKSKLLAKAALFSVVFLVPVAPASAQQSVAETIRTQCKAELAQYCSTVTPGRARYGGCLLAHNDKLSKSCEAAFEIGLLQLSIILTTVDHVIEQCSADIDEHCDGVVVGGGRIAQCLTKATDKLQPECKASFEQAKEDLQ